MSIEPDYDVFTPEQHARAQALTIARDVLKAGVTALTAKPVAPEPTDLHSLATYIVEGGDPWTPMPAPRPRSYFALRSDESGFVGVEMKTPKEWALEREVANANDRARRMAAAADEARARARRQSERADEAYRTLRRECERVQTVADNSVREALDLVVERFEKGHESGSSLIGAPVRPLSSHVRLLRAIVADVKP